MQNVFYIKKILTGGVWKPLDIACVFPACSRPKYIHHCFLLQDATHQMTNILQDLGDLLKPVKGGGGRGEGWGFSLCAFNILSGILWL